MGTLIREEERAERGVSTKVYKFYFKSVGYVVIGLFVFFMSLGRALELCSAFWLNEWSEASVEQLLARQIPRW